MNADEESPTATTTAHWLPSHVRITVHRAKDLHLKNKSGNSEVYARIESDQKSYFSTAVPKQTAPSWNEDIIIPLMSLATTIHIQVRQKGRFGDKYLGYFPISPGNFKVDPNIVTHWYKLGPKPGKSSSKLRGDLQISFQFLSKWSEKLGQGLETGMQDGLLKHSSSDLKLWNGNGIGPDAVTQDQQQSQSKNKKEILASLRRSFKRKNKSPSSGVTQNTDKDFLFTAPDASPHLKYVPKKSSAINVTRSSSISSGRPVNLGQFTDSESSLNSASPLPGRVKRSSEEAILELDSPSSNGEKRAGEKEVGSPMSSSASESKLPTEQQFQYFISKKKRYMPAKPVDSASTTSSNSDLTAGKTTPVKEDQPEGAPDVDPKPLLTDGSSSSLTPFTYRSRATKSFRESGRGLQSKSDTRLDEELPNESLRGSESAEISLSHTEESAMATQSPKVSATNQMGKTTTESENKSPNVIRSSATKTHPYSRKIDITPRKPSPSVERVRPRILSYENSKDDSSPFSSTSSPKPRNAQLKRRSTIANTSNRSRLLPATPVRRNTKTQLNVSGNSLNPPSRSAGNSCRNSLCLVEDMEYAETMNDADRHSSKLVNSSQDLSMCGKDGRDRLGPPGADLGAPGPVLGTRKNTTPVGSMASIDGKTERPSTPKVKHTVQYSGIAPISLLPPSDYTSRSSTLPTRGKKSKRNSNSGGGQSNTPSMDTSEPSAASAEKLALAPTPEKPQSAPPSQGYPSNTLTSTPTNIMYLPRGSLMNLPSACQTPPIQKKSSGKDEVDIGRSETPNLGFRDNGGTNAAKAGAWLSAPPMNIASSRIISRSIDYLPPRGGGYRGRTPDDIASSVKNKRPGGGIRKAMSLYQENRKQHVAARVRKMSSSAETTPAIGFPVDNDFRRPAGGNEEKTLLVDADILARSCASEGNSPPLVDRSREMTGSFGSVFISSLKKTSTLLFTGASKYKTQVSPDDGGVATDSAHHNSFYDNSTLSVDDEADKKSSAPAILMHTLEAGGSGSEGKSNEGISDSAVTSTASVPITYSSGDSSSVKTLTESDSRLMMDSTNQDIVDQRHSPNPAGAAAANIGGGGPHVRHTTASSVESEGFHSMASEDLAAEDWASLPKEELVKELIRSKRKIKENEEELKEVRNQLTDLKSYLDNILLRVMETNPAILSANQ